MPSSRFLVVLFIAFVCILAGLMLLPVRYLAAAFTIDDACYYLVVARNVVHGLGVTFDAHTLTNGFHPLWGLICAGLALVFGTGVDLPFRVAFCFQALCVMGGLFLLRSVTRSLGLNLPGTVFALMGLFFPRLDLWLSNMESAVSMLAILLLVAVSWRRGLIS